MRKSLKMAQFSRLMGFVFVSLQMPVTQGVNLNSGSMRWSNDMAAVAGYDLLIGFLVGTLLLGVLFVVYTSFQSQRPQYSALHQGKKRVFMHVHSDQRSYSKGEEKLQSEEGEHKKTAA